MSVKKEASGRRSVQVEVEVPGTPEEVWQAIATGPGISSWFVPTAFEERDGKPVAVTMADHVLVVDMGHPGRDRGLADMAKLAVVDGRDRAPPGVVGRQMAQLHPEHRSVQLVQPRVHA